MARYAKASLDETGRGKVLIQDPRVGFFLQSFRLVPPLSFQVISDKFPRHGAIPAKVELVSSL